MIVKDLWTLPDGVNEIPPEQALPLERLRRKILDKFLVHGYELVSSPLFEFLDSLLVGVGNEMDLETIKFVDQLSGKMMGLRADITPQIARFEAHSRNKNCPDRLCYVGNIGKARGQGVHLNRSPVQIGAELFGHVGVASDIEVVKLMLDILADSNLSQVSLDLGHVGIFKALVSLAKLNSSQEQDIVIVLQKRSVEDLTKLLCTLNIDEKVMKMFLSLIGLQGGFEVIDLGYEQLDTSIKPIKEALQDLKKLAFEIKKHNPDQIIHFDLSELRGYKYHTGLIFAAYVEHFGMSIAKGGRYDAIGEVFGKKSAATGFSANLDVLNMLSNNYEVKELIFAPNVEDENLDKLIAKLRSQKRAVVVELPNQVGTSQEMGCTHELLLIDNLWQLKVL